MQPGRLRVPPGGERLKHREDAVADDVPAALMQPTAPTDHSGRFMGSSPE